MFAFARTYLPHYFPLETPEFHRELMAHLEDIDEMKWFKTEVNPAFDPLQPYDEKTNWRVKKKVDSATGAHTPKEGIVLAAPRNHAKSTLFTLLLPIYCACFRTHRFIVIISDTHAQAESFANDIRAEFEENELIRRDFGDLNGAHWGKHWTIGDFVACHGEFDERGRRFIRHETRIVSRSSGSSMRGLRAREARPDLLVCDDLENEEHVETREQRDKLWTKFHGAIRNMMSPGAFFVVVGTILHFDSVLSRLLSQEYKDDYVQERYACTVGGVDVDDDRAKPIFPARWPLDQLRSRKATMPPKQFNSEYMNDPRDPSARDFRPEWFRFYHGRDLKRLQDGRTFWRDPRLPNAPRVREKQQWEELKQYQAVDPAISLEERADYFSIVAGGLTERTENIVVLWIVREHLAFAEQVQQIHSMAMTFPRTRLIGVEKVAFQDALRQAADGKAARRLSKTKIPLKGITHRSGPSNKESRLRRRSVDVMRGMVWLRRLDPGDPGYEEAPWDETHTVKIHPNHYLLYREMVDFPVGATDDVLDAFDMMVEIMGKRRLFEEFVKDAPQSRTRAQTKTLPFLEDLVLEAA